MRREPPRDSFFNKLLVGLIMVFWVTLAAGNWVGRYLIQQDLKAMSMSIEPVPVEPEPPVVAEVAPVKVPEAATKKSAQPKPEATPQAATAKPESESELQAEAPEVAKTEQDETVNEVAVAARPEPRPEPRPTVEVAPLAEKRSKETVEPVLPAKVELPVAGAPEDESTGNQPTGNESTEAAPAPADSGKADEKTDEVEPFQAIPAETPPPAEPVPAQVEPERNQEVTGRQVGAFANSSNAQRLADQLRQQGKSVEVEESQGENGTLYRVRAW